MSELEMECVEEELEPWQKSFPHIHLPQDEDDDDDEPIFVGVVSVQREEDHKAMDTNDKSEEKQAVTPVNPPSSTFTPINAPSSAAPSPMLPVSVVGTSGNAPQSIIVNNQGFIVTPQMTNNSNFFTSLGTPGTSFTFVSAQPQIFQHISQTPLVHSVVHRPQGEPVNDIMTLSNVQGSAIFNNKPVQAQVMQVNAVLPTIRAVNSSVAPVNGLSKHICTHCKRICLDENVLKRHIRGCKARVFQEAVALVSQQSGDGKRIMLVGEFYYGKFEGDGYTQETERMTTFKCHSCLKVLKNNIRFMNHMKHHLELEKQNSESFESHTTCQHCYRQYLTPFQLQCHIESAHSSVDSTTNCKICELAFESEQVLLDHMKNNHKPGEMPYVCQVCNFRSSFFSDVESHFRDAHANTKDLLCPFCLKVVKSGHIYMQHYMKHQKKGIFRCGKCRLNFLSFKEKVEHRTQVHKTFKKPEALEGLPPGTKVTIRASLAGKSSLPQSPQAQAGLIVSAHSQNDNDPTPTKSPSQKPHLENFRSGKSNVSQKKQKRTSKHNLALKNLRPGEKYFTCIECNTAVLDFFSHFPMLLHCGSCKYKTNCKKSIGNHMIRFHSTISKSRFSKENGKSSSLKLTLLCIKCDLLDASGGNRMIKHLLKRPNHICKVIKDRDPKAIEQVLTVEDLQPTSSETPNLQNERDSITNITDAEEQSPAQTQTSTKNTTTDCEQDNRSSEIIMSDSPEVLSPEEPPPEESPLESSCVNSAEPSERGEVRTNFET